MTNVTMEKFGTDIWITCYGHAGYAKPGEDIVCAAVSILCQTFEHLCSDYAEKNKIVMKELQSGSGIFHIWISDPQGCMHSTIDLLKIAFLGLSAEYPDHVHLTLGRNEI